MTLGLKCELFITIWLNQVKMYIVFENKLNNKKQAYTLLFINLNN